MAVRVSAESGFDPGYMLKGQAEQAAGERSAGGYYINAAQAGEAPGRWFGKGAEALGFNEGQVVEAAPFLAVYQQVHPVTGSGLAARRAVTPKRRTFWPGCWRASHTRHGSGGSSSSGRQRNRPEGHRLIRM